MFNDVTPAGTVQKVWPGVVKLTVAAWARPTTLRLTTTPKMVRRRSPRRSANNISTDGTVMGSLYAIRIAAKIPTTGLLTCSQSGRVKEWAREPASANDVR
jgi:hypothetical protein